MVNFSLRAFVAFFIFLSVSSVYAQTKVVVIPLFGDDAHAPIEYVIGDTGPAGGIVFHVTNGGLNGLEAAPVDQGTAPWNCLGTDMASIVNLATSGDLDPNSGAVNTPLVAVQCSGTETNVAVFAAAYVWPNGQTDGFLPNKEELNLLYAQKDIINLVGDLINLIYWSSSEGSSDSAWAQSFGLFGTQITGDKDATLRVRTIRAF